MSCLEYTPPWCRHHGATLTSVTNVTSRVVTVARHEWTVPCDTYDPHPYAVIGDLMDAYLMAKSEASNRGINTSCDDWCRVAPRDDEIVLFFDVEKA